MQRTEGDLEFKWLVPLEHDSVDTSIVDCEALLKEIESETSCAFQDAHNAGYYINEYTTKATRWATSFCKAYEELPIKFCSRKRL